MKYYVIAGEASGDLHWSNLIRALKTKDSKADFRGWGGDLMQAQGMDLVTHYKDLAFMGFIEVLFNLKTILKNIKRCKSDVLNYKPDALILVDYPGFNMRIAAWAKRHDIPVHYYIAPQAWAWKENRVKAIARDVTSLYVILPFEEAFFRQHSCPVHYVGHPLKDALLQKAEVDPDKFRKQHSLNDKPIIALLPGSRKQEISVMLPVMDQVAQRHLDHQFVVAGAPAIDPSFYSGLIRAKNLTVVSGETYAVLSMAQGALVTSGTATLETALMNVPQVVCYHGNWISYQIAKRIIKLSYISLVNLILDAPAVPELIQNAFKAQTLNEALEYILSKKGRQQQLDDYQRLQSKIGPEGASDRVASLIFDTLKDD